MGRYGEATTAPGRRAAVAPAAADAWLPALDEPEPVGRGGRRLFAVLVLAAFLVGPVLWWSQTPARSLDTTADLVLAAGRLTGLAAGCALLLQLLLMSRAGWLERMIGAYELLVWHREIGGYLFVAVLAHLSATTVGYAMASGEPLLPYAYTMVTTFEDMLGAFAAAALLVAVALLAVRAVRRRMSYEAWYFLHLGGYLVVVLGFAHQLTGEQLVAGAGRWYWLTLNGFVAVNVAWGRVVSPLLFNARHRLRVADVVAEGPDTISIYIEGRRLDGMRARAGQYFRWRFLTTGCWWQAHPFSLSAAPNRDWLRLTVKVVGDHTRRLRTLRPGVRIFAEGPSGVFTADRAVGRRALLIAGGSGIAPVRALLEDVPPGAVLIYRAGSERELVFREELDWLAQERRARVHYVLGDRHAPGPRRLLTPRGLREMVPDVASRDVYLCGPQGLVTQCVKVLRRLRVPRRQLHLDPFEL
ncbi:MAG TPA: ferric reductase-like transmembrane domain-containing protein [Micromonosporaceae bacterium]|nr:ferric reductase-like transmembrane domain-containing protein [Micromonosporaceae bacterium]